MPLYLVFFPDLFQKKSLEISGMKWYDQGAFPDTQTTVSKH